MNTVTIVAGGTEPVPEDEHARSFCIDLGPTRVGLGKSGALANARDDEP